MSKLLVINDPHYSRSEPECRAPSYRLEILEKFHATARLAKAEGAAGVLCTGDFLHRRGRATFAEVNDLLAVLSGWREMGLAVAGILGNHDVAGVGIDSMDSRAAGALYHGRVLQVVDRDPLILDEFHVTGTSYFSGCDRDDDARVRMYGGPPKSQWPPAALDRPRVHVHLAHGALVLRGDFIDEFTSAESLIPLLAEAGRLPDVIVCGHLHYPEGVRWFEVEGRRIAVARIGSLGRVSRDDLERIPAALVIEASNGVATLREVPIGKPPRPCDLPKGDPRAPSERDDRIREFVAKLREDAEAASFSDDAILISSISERLGHGERVALKALRAVELRREGASPRKKGREKA